MSLDEMNRKVLNAVEVFGGHIALGTMMTIITGTVVWMLSVEIEQGKILSALVALSSERLTELQVMHGSIDKVSAQVHGLELSVTSIRQELSDHEQREDRGPKN